VRRLNSILTAFTRPDTDCILDLANVDLSIAFEPRVRILLNGFYNGIYQFIGAHDLHPDAGNKIECIFTSFVMT